MKTKQRPELTPEQNYFPNEFTGYFDAYCQHLGFQLGPCQECDNLDYIAYCEESALIHEADPHYIPDYDTRSEADFVQPEPWDHIPLVTFFRPDMFYPLPWPYKVEDTRFEVELVRIDKQTGQRQVIKGLNAVAVRRLDVHEREWK